MSLQAQNLWLQTSTKDVVISYTNASINVPIIIQATGTTDIITFDNNGAIENVNYQVTADGATTVSAKPVFVSGTITMQWLSPARLSIERIQNLQDQLCIILPGTLKVFSPSGQWTRTFNNFAWISLTTAPDMVVDGTGEIKMPFRSAPPSGVSIGNAVTAVTSIANLIGF